MMILLWLVAAAILSTPLGFFVCCCGPCSAVVTVTLKGCNGLGLAGETITIKLGSTIVATATTDGSGAASFSLTAASYTIVYPTPTGFLPQSAGSFTVGSDCAPVAITTTLSVDTDHYVCCLTGARPWPKAMTYTDANGTVSAQFYDGGTFREWVAIGYVSKSNLYGRPVGTAPGTCTGPVSMSYPYQARISCGASGVEYKLGYLMGQCEDGLTLATTHCTLSPFSTTYTESGTGLTKATISQEVSPTSLTNAMPTSITGTWPSGTGVFCTDILTGYGETAPPVSGSFIWSP